VEPAPNFLTLAPVSAVEEEAYAAPLTSSRGRLQNGTARPLESAARGVHSEKTGLNETARVGVPRPTPAAAIMLAWGAVFLSTVVLLFRRTANLWRTVHEGEVVTDRETVVLAEECRRAVGLRRTPRIVRSSQICMPCAAGFVRPFVVLPEHLLEELSRDELRTVLLHEFSHVKRVDPLISLVQRLVQAFYLYHPAAWAANWMIDREREKVCDDCVLALASSGSQRYGATLVRAVELAPRGIQMAGSLVCIAETKRQLKERLLRIAQANRKLIHRLSARSVLALACFAAVILPLGQVDSGEADGSDADSGPLRVYQVDKSVSDFPEGDFSTPESAGAAIHRIMANGGDHATWMGISCEEIRERSRDGDLGTEARPPEKAQMWLNGRIVEVRVYKDTVAMVITQLLDPAGKARFDMRYVRREDGRWLNQGHDGGVDSLEDARQVFARKCARFVPSSEPRRGRVDDPEAYLKRFTQFLKRRVLTDKVQDPKIFVLDTLANHKVVIMGEIHHRPRYWAFNASLVEDARFAETVGTIYMELPSNDQALVDQFLAAEELDTMPVIDMLRDMLWMGWPDQPMLDFFVAVWKVNKDLPPPLRLRIVLVDMERPWEKIEKREDWNEYNVDRDRYMAENVIRDINEHPSERRNALFIVGVGHTMLNLLHPDETTPMKSAGWRLRQRLGADSVFAFFQHMPVQTNMGRVDGRLCLGLFDSAFAAVDNMPMAFPLTAGPFGEQWFDAMPDNRASPRSTYRDGYSAYLYLGPLEDEIFSPLIPGFYTDEFMKEIDRRFRMMYNKSWHEAYGRERTDPESFVDWMSGGGGSWGQPRKWTRALGPLNAWHHGDEWKDIAAAEKYKYALEHPEVIVDAATKLIDAIRTADYDNPATLRALDYTADHWVDVWAEWICKTFKENPIESVELGDVFKGEEGRPTIPYKLTLQDATILEGDLPFEYMSRQQLWQGWCGLDWHLEEEDE
jgi:beta-lactamase regulating signal transducer with metallopeptidase domain